MFDADEESHRIRIGVRGRGRSECGYIAQPLVVDEFGDVGGPTCSQQFIDEQGRTRYDGRIGHPPESSQEYATSDRHGLGGRRIRGVESPDGQVESFPRAIAVSGGTRGGRALEPRNAMKVPRKSGRLLGPICKQRRETNHAPDRRWSSPS